MWFSWKNIPKYHFLEIRGTVFAYKIRADIVGSFVGIGQKRNFFIVTSPCEYSSGAKKSGSNNSGLV